MIFAHIHIDLSKPVFNYAIFVISIGFFPTCIVPHMSTPLNSESKSFMNKISLVARTAIARVDLANQFDDASLIRLCSVCDVIFWTS